VLLMCCQCVANVLPMCCQCVANVLPMCCQCVANVLPMCCRCVANVLLMCCCDVVWSQGKPATINCKCTCTNSALEPASHSSNERADTAREPQPAATHNCPHSTEPLCPPPERQDGSQELEPVEDSDLPRGQGRSHGHVTCFCGMDPLSAY